MRGWCTWLVLTSLLLSVPFGAAAHAVPTQRAQIGPTAAPSAPFEPISRHLAQSSSAPFLVEVVHARILLAAAAAAVCVLTPTLRVGPGEAHVRLIERPPIAPLFAS